MEFNLVFTISLLLYEAQSSKIIQFTTFTVSYSHFSLYNIVPAGKPTITTAHNTSSSSIYLSWKPPPLDTIFGEFLGYRITYHARDVKPENINEIFVRDSSVEVSITVMNSCLHTCDG